MIANCNHSSIRAPINFVSFDPFSRSFGDPHAHWSEQALQRILCSQMFIKVGITCELTQLKLNLPVIDAFQLLWFLLIPAPGASPAETCYIQLLGDGSSPPPTLAAGKQ